jgi:hypothetical protein
MRMPGFTAEASLYNTSEHYHIAGTGISAIHLPLQINLVVPQQVPKWICLPAYIACGAACSALGFPLYFPCIGACWAGYLSCMGAI